MTRVAIYARYSTDLQNPRSIDDQVRDCRAYADRQGWDVVAVHSDAAKSGTNLLRAGLQDLLAAAADRQLDIVLLEALDRLSRDLGDTANLHKQLAAHDVTLHTIADGPVSLMHVGIKGTMSAMFIEDLKNKIRRGHRGTIARGRSAGGLAYGYEVVKQLDAKGELVRGLRKIREDQAAIVRRVFAEYVAGVAPMLTCARLNADGVPAPLGGHWSLSALKGSRARGNGIFHNQLYVGKLIHNRIRMVKDIVTGKRLSRMNPADAWQIVDVPDLRIVDDATWSAAQSRLLTKKDGDPKAGTAAQLRRPKHILSGLVRCGDCGADYISYSATHLRCSGYQTKRVCKNASKVDRARLETRVLHELDQLLNSPETVATAMKEYHDERRRLQTTHEVVRRQAAREISDVRGKITRLVAAIEAGGNDLASLTTRIRELQDRKAAAEADLVAADRELDVVNLAPNAHEIYARKVADLKQSLFGKDALTRARGMAELRGLVTDVKVYPRERGHFHVVIEGQIRAAFDLAAEQPQNKLGVKGGSEGAHKALTPTFRRQFKA